VNRKTDQAIKSRELENRPSNQKPLIGEQTKQSKAVNRKTDQAMTKMNKDKQSSGKH
jgi:hypothetical protein